MLYVSVDRGGGLFVGMAGKIDTITKKEIFFHYIIEKLHWKEYIAYYSILVPMFVINVLNIIDIANFLKRL